MVLDLIHVESFLVLRGQFAQIVIIYGADKIFSVHVDNKLKLKF